MEKITGRYKICGLLGAGGEGEVFLVQDLQLGRKAAMKYIHTDEKRFRDEIHFLKNLPTGIFPFIYDAWYEEKRGIIMMEYIEGMTGEAFCRQKGTVSSETVWKWGIVLAEALREMHETRPQLLYRDLKPANVMIQTGERIRLIDTGAVTGSSAETLRQGIRIGTNGFSSPEQWAGKQIDQTTDIYSLGATLHYFLTGRSAQGEMKWGKGAEVPEGMKEILEKCMQHDRKKRYPSMTAFLKDWNFWTRIGRRKKIRNRAAAVLRYLALLTASGMIWMRPEEMKIWAAALCIYLLTAFAGYREEKKESWWFQEKTLWLRNG